MAQRTKAVVIMAAGKGTRMNSRTTKLLHRVGGRPLIHYPIEVGIALEASRIVLILGHQRAEIETYVKRTFKTAPIDFVVQEEQLGTAHAVQCAQPALEGFEGDVIILSGDVPCLPCETLWALDEIKGSSPLGLVSMRIEEANRYGRVSRDIQGHAEAIIEFADCSEDQKKIEELNSGIYQVDAQFLFGALAKIDSDNAQGEFYLTDLVAMAASKNQPAQVLALDARDSRWAVGVNNRVDLAAAEAQLQLRVKNALMLSGVTMLDPTRVYVESAVQVGADTTLGLDVTLKGHTKIGEGCVIEQGCFIKDSEISEATTIRPYCHLEGAKVGPKCTLGPYARLREGTVLDSAVKVGNFVETKKAHFKSGSKANHLSYIGDASIGSKANIGAGTITCNYDGYKKSKTVIGEGAFIGSDTQLVAPVAVGDGAIVGAGTTVTRDVPADALAISRTQQTHMEGWAIRKRAREHPAKKDV